MKVIIAGGRNYKFTEEDYEFLSQLEKVADEVVCGGCSGADENGRLWAESKGIPVKIFKADWNKHGKAAGPIRNRQMAEYADVLVPFPGGRGTTNMINEAKKNNLYIMYPNGENNV